MSSIGPSMRSAVFAAAAFAGLFATPAFAADPVGVWLTEDGRARIRTEHCGPQDQNLCGFVVWGQKPADDTGKPRLDALNPDPAKRSHLIQGHQMIMGLKPADGKYEGKIYNAENGKFYDVKIWSDDAASLTVKGCMLAILCGSQTWTRVTDVAPGQLMATTNMPGGPRAEKEWAKAAPAPGAAPAPKPPKQ